MVNLNPHALRIATQHARCHLAQIGHHAVQRFQRPAFHQRHADQRNFGLGAWLAFQHFIGWLTGHGVQARVDFGDPHLQAVGRRIDGLGKGCRGFAQQLLEHRARVPRKNMDIGNGHGDS